MTTWNFEKMIENGGERFSVNGSERVSVPGLSGIGAAAYVLAEDKIYAFDVTPEDGKMIYETYHNNPVKY